VFLLLEEGDVVLMDKVVALVRGDGETAILMRDDTVKATCFTPTTLNRRSEKFWKDAQPMNIRNMPIYRRRPKEHAHP
jgi:hypothetical protein